MSSSSSSIGLASSCRTSLSTGNRRLKCLIRAPQPLTVTRGKPILYIQQTEYTTRSSVITCGLDIDAPSLRNYTFPCSSARSNDSPVEILKYAGNLQIG